MEKIIIKKERGRVANNGDAIGYFKPIFIVKDNKFTQATPEDFPNDGEIYMPKDTDSFESNGFYCLERDDIKINTQYENMLRAYEENPNLQSPSKFLIHANKVQDLLPTDLIPIYSNKFSLKTQSVLEYNNIKSEIFFLEADNNVFGPFKKNNRELDAAHFKSFEDDFEDFQEFGGFLEIYSDFDGEYIFKINNANITNFLISDVSDNLYLTDFKSIVLKNIGEPILFCGETQILDWGKNRLSYKNPEFSNIIKLINSNSSNESVDKDKWEKFKEILENEAEEVELENIKNILSYKGYLTNIDNKKLEELELNLREKEDEINLKNKDLIRLKEEIEENKQIPQTSKNIDNDYDKYASLSKALKAPDKLEALLLESNSVDFFKGLSRPKKSLQI